MLALAPFAFAYGLVYWGEQYVPSGLAAVLFGVLPLYTALLAGVLLPDEPLRAPLLVGVLIAIGGLGLAFLESVELGSEDKAALGAAALALAPLGAAIGGVAQNGRAGELGRGVCDERLGRCSWAAFYCCRRPASAQRDGGDAVGTPSRSARSPIWRRSGPAVACVMR